MRMDEERAYDKVNREEPFEREFEDSGSHSKEKQVPDTP